jgi:hypothetical protein
VQVFTVCLILIVSKRKNAASVKSRKTRMSPHPLSNVASEEDEESIADNEMDGSDISIDDDLNSKRKSEMMPMDSEDFNSSPPSVKRLRF